MHYSQVSGAVNWTLYPEPPGTINPARLSTDGWMVPDRPRDFAIPGPAALWATPPSFGATIETAPSPFAARSRTAPGGPRLTRYSSDWDPKDEFVFSSEKLRQEFEKRHAEDPHLYSSKARASYLSHYGYFRRQTMGGKSSYFVRPDPDVPDAYVVVDPPTTSIYDAFLLRSDSTQNANVFYRQQVQRILPIMTMAI
jgi:hypothetical protein